jgi:hypothetical protein
LLLIIGNILMSIHMHILPILYTDEVAEKRHIEYIIKY